jgi:hypothetical protein
VKACGNTTPDTWMSGIRDFGQYLHSAQARYDVFERLDLTTTVLLVVESRQSYKAMHLKELGSGVAISTTMTAQTGEVLTSNVSRGS